MAEADAPMETASFLSAEWVEQPVAYNTRDLLLYALGVGCTKLRHTFEQDMDFEAFPTYPVVLSFKGPDVDVVDFPSDTMIEGPEMPELPGWMGVALDGERYIEKVEPLDPEGGELTLRSRLVGIHKRGSGASVETESELLDEDGAVLYRMVSGSFLVGADGFADSGVSHSETVEPPARPADRVVEVETSAQQAALYRLSGDYNPLHIDPDTAEAFGFEQPILHGLATLGLTARAVLEEFGGSDAARWRAMKVRFAAPVLPGEALVVEMWEEGEERVVVLVKSKASGVVVINNCYVQLQPAEDGSESDESDEDSESDDDDANRAKL